jgi:hypothetical protein
MLPSIIPQARIFTYDWNANTFSNAATEDLPDHAKTFLDKLLEERGQNVQAKPLVFVASCFGGLLLAKTLRSAYDTVPERPYRKILECTVGIIFLGTPFFGSQTAKTAEIRAALVNTMGGEAYKGLLEDLSRNNRRLDETIRSFAQLIHYPDTRIPTKCFFETKKTSIGNAVPRWLRLPTKILLKPTIVGERKLCEYSHLT